MYTEQRFSYYDHDNFDPKVEAFKSLVAPHGNVIAVDIASVMATANTTIVHQLVLKLGVEQAKLLIAKLQEGIDKHEGKTGV